MAHVMTPGEAAFYRAQPDRHWLNLTDEERAAFELGASLPPVGAVFHLVQESQTSNT